MSGIYPNSGIPFKPNINAVDVPTTGCTVELFYDPGWCGSRFDPLAQNAVMSEILNVTKSAGIPYDCSILTNLSLSVSQIALNATSSVSPCNSLLNATLSQLLSMTGSERVVTCINGTTRSVKFSDFPFDLQTIPNSTCNLTKVAFATDANGQGRLYQYTDASIRVGRWFIDNTYAPNFTQNFPTLPAISEHNVSHYTVEQLLADAIVDPRVSGGTAINTARLKNTLVVNSNVFTISCQGNYDITYISIGGIQFNPTNAGVSTIVYSVDDGTGEKIIVSPTLGSVSQLGNVTSFERDLNLTATAEFLPGSYRVYIYIVAGLQTANAAQIRVSAIISGGLPSSSGSLIVSKSLA